MSAKFILLMLMLGASTLFAAPASKSRPLDTAAIRHSYMEGEFDQAIDDIEIALKRGGPFSHQDSVFMFKHLGVMHAAKYETREKGRYYMMQLLTVEPTARILDMYASEMIYMIFKNIQAEFEANRPRPQLVDITDTIRTPPAGKPPEKKRSRAWIGWTAGAVAATGGVALTLHLLSEPDSKDYIGE